MKKLVFIIMISLTALTMQAQKCAVFDFQVGNNITEEEVDGFSYIFRSNFNPTNYTVIDRMRVNQVISNYHYSRTDMTRQQMLRVGRELEALVVVVGTMNKFLEEYSVDIQIIDVSRGTTVATEGAAFQKSDYRTTLNSLAQKLIRKLSNGHSSTTGPTVEGYTDLGLPSGTKWKNFNASGFYTYDEAVSQFGNRLPSKEQWEELRAECEWSWTGSGYKVTGPNGNSVNLSASGYRECSGGFNGVDEYGGYWSSTSGGSDNAWDVYFSSIDVGMYNGLRCCGLSVRLVQD